VSGPIANKQEVDSFHCMYSFCVMMLFLLSDNYGTKNRFLKMLYDFSKQIMVHFITGKIKSKNEEKMK
jgi:hypothetical protein